jgi:Cu2+-exporting ATPase
MAQAADFSLFARTRPDGAVEMELAVEGIACGGCIARIERTLLQTPGVVDARVNFTNRRLTAAWRPGEAAPEQVIGVLEHMGYAAHPFAARAVESEDARAAGELLRCLAAAGFAATNVMLLSVSVWSGNAADITPETRDFFHWLSALIAIPAVAYAGRPFFRSAFAALRNLSVSMDVPISLGVILAIGMSLFETINHADHAYFDSAVMLLFFLLCGRYLDRAMRARTRAVAGNLAALRAETAQRLGARGELVEVPAAALQPGDRIMVRPGDRLPADGVVVAGTSEVDESLVTGETISRTLGIGAAAYAGSLNHSGALTVRVTAAGERTLLDEIERLLDRAVKTKSRYVRLSDRAARLYAPVVHSAAALTLIGWLLAGASAHAALIAAITVLIITCPCALALAVPAVQVVAAARLFRSGVILNNGDAIERLAEVDTVVFDKTGTLTLPEARVANTASVPPDLLALAARLALSSRHPLAAAVARAGSDKRPLDGVSEEPGRGVCTIVDGIEAKLGSLDYCCVDAFSHLASLESSLIAVRHGARVAVFEVTQALRPGARDLIDGLRKLGVDIRILSGDRAPAVLPVARALGLDNWQAEVTPARKVAALQTLKSQGRRVLMVGDGINDAPALAAAHVSLSPISAAELAQAHADAVFLGARLTPVLDALTTARKARSLMRQNLILAVVYNMFAIPIAVAGLVTPLIAALAMSGSSMLVTANALRVRWRGERPAPEIALALPAMQTPRAAT